MVGGMQIEITSKVITRKTMSEKEAIDYIIEMVSKRRTGEIDVIIKEGKKLIKYSRKFRNY